MIFDDFGNNFDYDFNDDFADDFPMILPFCCKKMGEKWVLLKKWLKNMLVNSLQSFVRSKTMSCGVLIKWSWSGKLVLCSQIVNRMHLSKI